MTKLPTELALALAAITAVLGVTVIWSSASVLIKRSPSLVAARILKAILLFGIALLATAVYMASWGLVPIKK